MCGHFHHTSTIVGDASVAAIAMVRVSGGEPRGGGPRERVWARSAVLAPFFLGFFFLPPFGDKIECV